MQDLIKSSGIMPYTRAVLSARTRIFAVNYRDPAGGFEQVGAIQTFDVNNTRNLEPLRGIGLGDHIIEMVPGQSEPIELSVTRFALSMANLFQEFGYPSGADGLVRALKHHRYPIDIKQEQLVSKLADQAELSSIDVNGGSNIDGSRLVGTGGSNPTLEGSGNYQGFARHDKLDNGDFGFFAVVTWFEGCWFSNHSYSQSVDTATVSEQASLMVTDVSGFDDGKIVLPFTPAAMERAASKIWYTNGIT